MFASLPSVLRTLRPSAAVFLSLCTLFQEEDGRVSVACVIGFVAGFAVNVLPLSLLPCITDSNWIIVKVQCHEAVWSESAICLPPFLPNVPQVCTAVCSVIWFVTSSLSVPSFICLCNHVIIEFTHTYRLNVCDTAAVIQALSFSPRLTKQLGLLWFGLLFTLRWLILLMLTEPNFYLFFSYLFHLQTCIASNRKWQFLCCCMDAISWRTDLPPLISLQAILHSVP